MPRRKTLTNNNTSENDENAILGAPRAKKRFIFNNELPQRRNTIGVVLVCGNGDTGQLGLGEDVLECKRLTVIEKIPNAVDVCAGGMHSLVLTNDGDIYSFGCNDEGALGRDTSADGSETVPARVELPKKALCISAGDSHSACLLEDGSVYAWGSFRDSHGNMGLTNDGNKRMPISLLEDVECCSIASGADHLVILTTTGKVYTVGCAEQGQLGRISERSVSGEGRRGKRDLLRPDQVILKRSKPISAIWATNYCTFMRETQTNNIWAVGLNNYKQLIYDKTIDRVLNPIKITVEDIKQIAGGQHHTLVLKTDNKCYAIGRPEYGRLGLGSQTDVVDDLTIIKSLSNEKVVYIGCGESCSYAITDEGKLYSWGMGTNSQLGIGDGDDELEPVLVQNKSTQRKKFLKVCGGGQHSIFLAADLQDPQKENMPKANKDDTNVKEQKESTVNVNNTVEKSVSKSPSTGIANNRGRKRK